MPVRWFADPVRRRQWVEERNLQVFPLYDPRDPFPEVDLFATEPLPFDDLVDASELVQVDGIMARVAALEHLIAMKQAVGRAQDREDVAALHRLQQERGQRAAAGSRRRSRVWWKYGPGPWHAPRRTSATSG